MVEDCKIRGSDYLTFDCFQTPKPMAEMRTFLSKNWNSDSFGDNRSLRPFLISRNTTCDSSRRAGFVIVIDRFGMS